ncbi:MAG: secondary thiamine-phosphate synthase enzyme YjbQ [Candidatus Omnitrophota bacterium]
MSNRKLSVIDLNSSKKNEVIDITGEVQEFIQKNGVNNGVCFIYVPHTTAAVSVNENADPDVKKDMLMGLDNIVSSELGYDHVEGNSPAHIKSSIIGNTIQVFIENNELVLGTWQGIYFCEFDGPRSRKVYIKVLEG